MEVLVVERFDVYDSNGRKTGIVKEDSRTLEEGQYKMAVAVWFLNDDDKFLIQKRAETMRTAPSMFGVTSGSSITGEEPKETAIRECCEELGIEISENDLILLDKIVDGNYLMYFYIVHKEIEIDKLKLQSSEVASVFWKTYNEIKKLMYSGEFFCNRESVEVVGIYLDFLKKNRKIG